MSDERRARLARLLRERAAGAGPRRWRLSVGQEAMYLLESVNPTADLRMGEALTITGPLDVAALERAAVRLHERHPILASVVVPDDSGDLVQEVRPTPATAMTRADASGLADDELDARLAAEIERPFDLATDTPLRLALHTTGPDRSVLLFVLHHLAGDFWTLVILVRDLVELYRAECTGRAPELPSVVADFADYAALERAEADGERGAEHAAYWRRTLRDLPGPLQLPPDLAAAGGSASSLHGIDVPDHVAEALRATAARLGATRYQVLLAAYAVFLARHTGSTDVVVGAPVTQRAEPRWRDVAGYLINSVPVRLHVEDDLRFADLVAQAREQFLAAFEHGSLPYPRIVEALREEAGGADPGPLFDTLLVLRGNPVGELSAVAGMSMGDGGGTVPLDDATTATSRGLPRRAVAHPIALSLGDVDGHLRAGWDYQPDRFRPQTVARFADRFVALLEQATRDDDVAVADLTALSPRDEAELSTWSTAPGVPSPGRTLHAGFLRRAAADPDAEALVCGATRFTYGELDVLARRQAAALAEQGVRPGDRVAVHVPRGWEQVVAVLGVTLCGAAYVPVDPALPAARRVGVMEQADVRHVLVRDGAPDLWPPACVRGWSRVVTPGTDAPGPVPRHELPDVPSDALAYIIFTSGSTGTPKGVMIEHGAACTTLDEVESRLRLGPWSRVLALSSLSFDLSVFDIFGILGAGGAVVVPQEADVRDPGRWCALVRDEAVTVWNTVPALAQLAVEQATGTDDLAAVRWYMLSGDWIPLSLPDALRDCSSGTRVLGMGGATEAAIWSIAHEVGDLDPSWTSVPYGRPLAGQSFHVLDDAGRDVPPGVAGELCIGGAGLARGYVADPERTAESFVHSASHGRLYRTGDLGRYRDDGLLEFLGRRDRQVKINGYRVEIGEVEAVLRDQPGVEDVHVVSTDALGGRRLVAFVTGAGADAGRVRRGAADRLPEYMLPATVEVLDEWPLTANGKVDHAALLSAVGTAQPTGAAAAAASAADAARPESAASAPAGGTDETSSGPEAGSPDGDRVVAAVRTVLGVDAGPEDSFLSLGGDSVAAIRVAMALRKHGLAVGAGDLLLAPTLGAVPVGRAAGRDALSPARPGRPGERDGDDLPVTPMQSTMYLHSMTSGVPGLYCEHVLLDLHGHVDLARLERAWQHVVDREPSLRARVHQRDDGALRQQPDRLTVLVEEVLVDDGDVPAVLDRLVAEDRELGFDLAAGPLTWWRLVREPGADRAVLVWTHHHLLVDGWSLPLVLRAVLRAYADDVGPAVGAPDSPGTDLATLLHAQEERGRVRRTQTAHYWEDTLDEDALGTPVPRDAEGAFRHAETETTLDEAEHRALLDLAARARVTMSTVVQGAWAAVLAARSGDRQTLFGLTLAGRDAATDGLDDAVGMLVNTVPRPVDVDPSAPVHSWLREVQRTGLEAAAHADVQLSELERSVSRDVARGGDLFDSIVVFENLPLDDLGAGGGGIAPGALRFTEVIGMPLALYAFPGRTLTLRVSYDASGWDRRWADTLLAELRRTVRALADHDGRTALGRVLRQVPATPDTSRGVVAGRGWGEPVDVVDRILTHAGEDPGRAALQGGGEVVTYAELADRALRVARGLRDDGVGTDDVVSVVAPRSVQGIVLQLGVLAAGATYAPSTPDHPRVVAEHRLTPDDVGSDAPLEAPVPRHDGAAAYVVHTSGSTGTPRGVVVPHSALAAFVGAAVARYGLRPDDRVLHFATPEFDAAVEEVWCGLAAGACVVVRDEGWTDSVDDFLDRVETSGCTVLDLPTAFWAEVVGHLTRTGRRMPEAVRRVIIGGEAVPVGALGDWPAVAGRSRLTNSYGPTETTVVVTAGDLL